VIVRAHHLHDDRLFDYYLAAKTGETPDPPSAEHLGECEACAARYAELTAFMDGLRADAAAEADAVFTPERLWAQQQHIMRRVEHVGRAARVISFPGRVTQRMAVATRVAPRWLAAAAAAGLFVGVAVGGMLFDSSPSAPTATTLLARTKPVRRMTPPPVRVTSPASVVEEPQPVAPVAPAKAASADDDTFLSELENALQHRPRELQPYDALTPHVRDVSAQLR
jgi:anti-sigma factor RsiW